MRFKCIASLIVLAALGAGVGSAAEEPSGVKPRSSASLEKEQAPASAQVKAPVAAPVAPDSSQPAGGAELSAGPSEGSVVVDQILKDKEDLITGKRFIYDPAGRRDPFRSLLEQVSRFKGPRPKGIKGMLITEADLVGTVRDPRGNIAFFKGSDNKGYFLHVGDELYDGRVIAIDADAGMVTFRQQVDDPRQIKPYRDIVKRVSPLVEEEAQ